ncbi:MAG: right-handed parallel beta-helix repeat-containing protein [Candidatus Moranbacteria bacterium]|nr:right-handed parallel beta-helix repeat-containing protein [Candidatus Moranbacteria bacterium]
MGVVFFFSTPVVFAGDYDIYVDKNAEEDGDGREESPYRTIGEALAKGTGKRSISIAQGTYDESLTLDDSFLLHGAGRGRTIISGTILVKNNSELENLTLRTSAFIAITVEGGADFSLEDSEIRGFGKIGINVMPGTSKIVVKDSAIHSSKGKGLYVQKGHRLEVSDSRIYGNAEEGIDVRNNVNGFIKNNAVYENGEGGMEIIIGSSDMVISKNKFAKNKASGIATQFYATATKAGQIQILDNIISKNGKYGIDCNIPSGGKPGPNYWARSIELRGNRIEDNEKEEINRFCRLIKAVDADEEADNAITEDGEDTEVIDATVLSDQDLEEERIIWQQIESMAREDEAVRIERETLEQRIAQSSPIGLFFFGVNQEDLERLREENRKSEEKIESLKVLVSQARAGRDDGDIMNFIQEEEEKNIQRSAFIQEQERHKGILGWFLDLFV